jgi:hypothetical protein
MMSVIALNVAVPNEGPEMMINVVELSTRGKLAAMGSPVTGLPSKAWKHISIKFKIGGAPTMTVTLACEHMHRNGLSHIS